MISREFTFRFPSSLSAQDVNEINDVFVLNRGCTNSTPTCHTSLVLYRTLPRARPSPNEAHAS